MSNGLNGKSLFIDFDSTFVKVETIDEIARITLQDNADKDQIVKKISKECSKFKLQYDIYDGLNEKIYSSLSKKSLDQTISEMEVEVKNSD